MSSLAQGSSASVIKFLREKKIKREAEQQAEQQARQQSQKQAHERQEIEDYFKAQRAPLINIQRELRNFLKNRDPGKGTLLREIKQRMGIPDISHRRTKNYNRNLNETPESISQAVALQGEILSTLKREWEAKKAEEKAVEEAAKEAERQRIRERNEKEKRDKEEELARLRLSLRPRVEEDVAKTNLDILGRTQYSQLTGNKVYDEMFAELVQPRVEHFQKEKSRKGVQEAYEYISRRQKDGIKHLGQWTGSELTPIEEEILERLKTAINNNGFQSDIVKEIFNEYLKANNHSGGRRKTRRARKHRRRSTHRKH